MPVAKWKIICKWKPKHIKFRNHILIEKFKSFRKPHASHVAIICNSFLRNKGYLNERLFVGKYRYGAGLLFFGLSQQDHIVNEKEYCR
jgi:hypothetical protein